MKTPPPSEFVSDFASDPTEQKTCPDSGQVAEKSIKYYYLYIGSGIEGLDDKDHRFIIESEKLVIKNHTVCGQVVARNKKAYNPLGFTYNGWTNCVDETLFGLYPCFVRVHQEWVEQAIFYEKSL